MPAGGLGVTARRSAPPLLQRWEQGTRTKGLGAAGPAPPPGTRQHPPPRPTPGGVGGSALERAPPARRGSHPRPPRPPHSLAFPGRGLCSSLCAVPTSSAFTACTSSCSFPMARPGPQRRGCAPCARRGSEAAAAAAPRHRPHPPPSPAASSAARAPRRPRAGAPAPAPAPGAEGAGSASRAGGGPGAGAGGGGRGAGARHLAPPPGRLGPAPAAADLRPPAPAARPAPWLRPYIRPRPPETPPPHVRAARVRPGLCGHPAAPGDRQGLGTAAAGGPDTEPRHGGGARLSLRGFQRLRDPSGEGLRGSGRAGTGYGETWAPAAREPARQRLSDVSGPWFPWEVSRDCGEESPNNEFGVRELAPPLPSQLHLIPLQPLFSLYKQCRQQPPQLQSEPQSHCRPPASTGVQPPTYCQKGLNPSSPAPTGV